MSYIQRAFVATTLDDSCSKRLKNLYSATPISEVAKKHGVSDVTIHPWRKRFGQLESVDAKRLCELEQENAKLKKLLAERASRSM